MPSFPNPFAGNVDRKMTNTELMQALRIDIAGELEAIFLYDARATCGFFSSHFVPTLYQILKPIPTFALLGA